MSEVPEAVRDSRRSRRFFRLAFGFWGGATRTQAWLLTSAVLFFVFANLGTALAVNQWNKFFFDALEQKDTRKVFLGIAIILALALCSAAFSAGLLHSRMRLQVRWRQWLGRLLIAQWLADRRFYQLAIVRSQADNPEGRIAEDGRIAIELLVEMALGALNAVLAAVAFIAILWTVGGALTVGGVAIPGYMVFACILYSAMTTLGMYLMGRPLVRRIEEKAAGEAHLRYELTRVKDNAENIALIGGDGDERERLEQTFSDLVRRWLRVIVWERRMMWLGGANLVLAPVVPLLLGSPKYLAGEMTLGSLMQAVTAFMQAQLALNWLADNATRIADWLASSHRVTELSDAIDHLESSLGPAARGGTITVGTSPDNRLHLCGLSIALPDGKLTVDGGGTIIAPGEKVLVKGDVGTGKSTLIHAMANLWSWGSGEILRPEGAEIAFLPQRPYFPLGTLRTALLYPHADRPADEETIRDVLVRCGLEHLISRLDESDEWSLLLSTSEQQRLAFARVLIHPPDILVMDEPTSSLDELSEFKLMEYMRDLLPDTMVIHAGHRKGLELFHDREIRLIRETRLAPDTKREPEMPSGAARQRPH